MTTTLNDIRIIQGGMGVGVSSWRLARAVAETGQLGVVSGTALGLVLARRLQLGDLGGDLRAALSHFPYQDIAARVLERYFVPGGKSPDAPFRPAPMPALNSRRSTELIVAGNFVEVFLARQGHEQPVGINYLQKIQLPTTAAIYGAMLAGVGVVIMGAGIPRAIPGVLDRFAAGEPVRLPVAVADGDASAFAMEFDPAEFCGATPPSLDRPRFLPVVASAPLANVLVRKANGRVDGFVVEGSSAGGHNAPPRGALSLSESGEPVYGPRDVPDLGAFRGLGLPFWLAGSQGAPGRLAAALEQGATGIQVGTAFAYCEESGFPADLKRRVLDLVRTGAARVRTDPRASPTGFPFKVLELSGTLSDPDMPKRRDRACDLGFLRSPYVDGAGRLGWRCSAEPEADYVRKGGDAADTDGRMCICNGLTATIGLGQVRPDGVPEAPVVTSGDDIATIEHFVPDGADSYAASDVVAGLLAPAGA